MISFSRKWNALQNYWTRTLRNLRTSRSPSWPFLFPSVEFCEICYSCNFCDIYCSIFSHSKKNPCYFCNFCDIWGHFGALLGFLFFLSLEFCYICYFCDICHGCFQLAWKILVTFAIFEIFADISGPFLASFLCKSRILLHLVFLRYLSWLFLANMKNPCYFCDFSDICGHFRALLGFFCFQVLILVRFVIFAIFVSDFLT